MKYLILLLLITACGKHKMPAKQELGDRDGDQIIDELETSEFDKNVADITPFGNIEAELRFQQGMVEVEKNVLRLENITNLLVYTKDLMTKNLSSLPVNEYFSEQSVLRLKGPKIQATFYESHIFVKLVFKDFIQSKVLSLVTKNGKIELGKFEEVANLKLEKHQIEAILKGESFFAISRETKKEFFLNSQESDIKTKTYRVFMDNGKDIKIYYVSKSYPLKSFLTHFKIKSYKDIEEANLLTTTYQSELPEWWIRTLHDTDKVIIHEDLKNLADHYLLNFKTNTHKVLRVNGYSKQHLVLTKSAVAKSLVKIRPTKQNAIFKEVIDKGVSYHQGRPIENGDSWKCNNYYLNQISKVNVPVNESDIRDALQVKINGRLYEHFPLEMGIDKNGVFWEIGIASGVEHLELSFNNLPAADYFQTGLFHSKCTNNGAGPKIIQNLRTNEDHFQLNVEAFIENI
ncbi:MAG: hypothetical protein H0V66_13865 [Bdellovibrionales bacterium]|nr:hypothetical protein [Bdellovibrionales bacterium]